MTEEKDDKIIAGETESSTDVKWRAAIRALLKEKTVIYVFRGLEHKMGFEEAKKIVNKEDLIKRLDNLKRINKESSLKVLKADIASMEKLLNRAKEILAGLSELMDLQEEKSEVLIKILKGEI